MNEKMKEIGWLILRVSSGLMMATHGYSKVFGLGSMEKFTGGVAELGFPMPGFFAWAAALAELVGGVCLALGIATRFNAALIAVVMAVAAFMRHAGDPFAQKEKALLYLFVMLFFVFAGSGKWGVCRYIPGDKK